MSDTLGFNFGRAVKFLEEEGERATALGEAASMLKSLGGADEAARAMEERLARAKRNAELIELENIERQRKAREAIEQEKAQHKAQLDEIEAATANREQLSKADRADAQRMLDAAKEEAAAIVEQGKADAAAELEAMKQHNLDLSLLITSREGHLVSVNNEIDARQKVLDNINEQLAAVTKSLTSK